MKFLKDGSELWKEANKKYKMMNVKCKIKSNNSFFIFSILSSLSFIFLSSCSATKQIERAVRKNILTDSQLQSAHIGISVYDASANKYLYNYQGDKYFIPASNTKIITCYAAMKYLGDSLVGAEVEENWNTVDRKSVV